MAAGLPDGGFLPGPQPQGPARPTGGLAQEALQLRLAALRDAVGAAVSRRSSTPSNSPTERGSHNRPVGRCGMPMWARSAAASRTNVSRSAGETGRQTTSSTWSAASRVVSACRQVDRSGTQVHGANGGTK